MSPGVNLFSLTVLGAQCTLSIWKSTPFLNCFHPSFNIPPHPPSAFWSSLLRTAVIQMLTLLEVVSQCLVQTSCICITRELVGNVPSQVVLGLLNQKLYGKGLAISLFISPPDNSDASKVIESLFHTDPLMFLVVVVPTFHLFGLFICL